MAAAEAIARPSPRPFPWAHVVWFGALLCLCYAPVIANIAHQWWSDDDMSHGVFVPLAAGYIIWQRRESLLAEPAGGSRFGVLLIVAGALLACLGALAAEIFTERVALLVSLAGLVWFFGGPRIVRLLAFPLGLLVFMLPLPGILYKEITFPLQLLASRAAEFLLETLGYVVLREGNVLELAGRPLSVAEACSGIRSLLSLGFFSLCYGWLVSARGPVRGALLAAAIPAAVAANIGRVVITAMLAECDPALSQGFFHAFSGWAMFLVAIGLLIGFERLLTRIFAR